MRHADQRERAVAVHEAAHIAMSYWNKFTIGKTRIKRNGNVTTGEGIIQIPPYPTGWRTDKEAQLNLKVHFYKCLMVFSSGYLAEFMHSGEKVFWAANVDLINKTEKTDLQVMREVAATIPKKEFKKVLFTTHEQMADPRSWGLILDIAKKLLKQKVIKGFPALLDEEHRSEPTKPLHNPSPLIKFMADALWK